MKLTSIATSVINATILTAFRAIVKVEGLWLQQFDRLLHSIDSAGEARQQDLRCQSELHTSIAIAEAYSYTTDCQAKRNQQLLELLDITKVKQYRTIVEAIAALKESS